MDKLINIAKVIEIMIINSCYVYDFNCDTSISTYWFAVSNK